MLIRKPSYFDTFHCIASACPDSCCKEWDVLVDPDKAAFYRSLPGPLGDRLRQVLKEEDGDTYMMIENRRCPMWRNDGLCRIQAELGEEAPVLFPETDIEYLNQFYPGIADIELKQFSAGMAPVTNAPFEIFLVEVADGADVGCGSVINPGTVIGRNTSVYPLTALRGVYPANCIVKDTNTVVERQ